MIAIQTRSARSVVSRAVVVPYPNNHTVLGVRIQSSQMTMTMTMEMEMEMGLTLAISAGAGIAVPLSGRHDD